MRRRDFFAVLGGGIVVLLVDDSDAQEAGGGARRGTNEPAPTALSAWLHIGEDGRDHGLHRQGRGRPELAHVADAGGGGGTARAGRFDPHGDGRHRADAVRHGHLRQPDHAAHVAADPQGGRDRARNAGGSGRAEVDRWTAATIKIADGKVVGRRRTAPASAS